MKTLIVNGVEYRVRKIAIEFSPNNLSGVAGVTVWFDKKLDGCEYRQYLPDSEEFKQVFSKLRYRKTIEAYLGLSFSEYKTKDAALDVPN